MRDIRDEDIELKIAEILEPRPTENGQAFGAPYYGTSLSPLLAWVWIAKWGPVPNAGNTGLAGCVDNGSWQPRRFLTDPAAILILMERRKIQVRPTSNDKWAAFAKDAHGIGAVAESIGRAVCLAFLAAHEKGVPR